MISIVCGTNRKDSFSMKIVSNYKEILDSQGAEAQVIDLADLPRDIAFSEVFGERTEAYEQDFIQKVEKSSKFVFVIPEYNGGFPGVLKLFIDSVPPRFFHHKKAGLIGLSSGRAGAARAMDQFGNVLNYLQVDVIAQKPKFSGIEDAMSDDGVMEDEGYLAQMKSHAQKMISI